MGAAEVHLQLQAGRGLEAHIGQRLGPQRQQLDGPDAVQMSG
jgi:hypothetical protein